jgi:uncharacterized membrane protein (DUF485 family)
MSEVTAVSKNSDIPDTGQGDDPYLVIERTPMFQDLRHRYRIFIFPMGVVFLTYYFLLIIAAGWAPEWMATPVWGAVNIGMVFALSEFVTTFLIAWLYTRYADRAIDPEANLLKAEFDELVAAGTKEQQA